jgi:membrane associated rhomboid family serine protease
MASRMSKLPLATIVLVILNIAAFMLVEKGGYLSQTAYDHGFRPAAILRGEALYTIVTSAFLHANWEHLIGNMISLVVFGLILERRIGARKFLLIYFAAHVIALLFALVIQPGSEATMVGASAAISGIMGACYMACPRQMGPLGYFILLAWPLVSLFLPSWATISTIVSTYLILYIVSFAIPVPLWPFALSYFSYQLVKGFEGIEIGTKIVLKGVGYWAHITGFLAGVAFIPFLRPKKEEIEPLVGVKRIDKSLRRRVRSFLAKFKRSKYRKSKL